MYNQQIFKVVDGLQKTIRYFYIAILLATIYLAVSGYMRGTDAWVVPAMRVLTAVELFMVVLFFGLKLSKMSFGKIDGMFLGAEVHNMILYWDWLESKIKDMLIYNGMLGFVMYSFYL